MSGLIGATELEQMQRDLAAVRSDREVSVVLRRGSSTLTAQPVRIARTGGRAQFATSGEGSERRAEVILLGGTDFDVQVGDRFTADGVLYRVRFVRPNRDAAVVAEAEAVE